MADVCEAIDFLNFYGREMLRLGDPKKLAETPGEDSRLLYEPRGVAAVIAPWNFPLAISTGMTAAALVAGNTVVYKPAEESAGVGAGMVRIFREAGVPPGVLNFLPGDGPRIGGFLVAHADVALIAFTGSMEVGLEIVRRCAETPEGQRGVKKVIAEMGGKNAIIIDTDADFDLAVRDVIHSAFSFQGQKCSACSRLILPEAIHDRFLERLIPAIKSIPIGLAEDPSTHIGPVVSREARQKVERYIEIGREEGTVTLQLNPAQQDGHFVPITVLTNIAPHHRVAQEEIFGPVLSVIKVKDFSEALEVANSTRFALTGAVFSRSPRNIETARRRFQVGNLYINRSCTGALVERHPFGGFQALRVGLESRRRGLSPEILGGPHDYREYRAPGLCAAGLRRRSGSACQGLEPVRAKQSTAQGEALGVASDLYFTPRNDMGSGLAQLPQLERRVRAKHLVFSTGIGESSLHGVDF